MSETNSPVPTDSTGSPAPASGFTQEDLDRVAGQARASERAKYADYQEKSDAAERLKQFEEAQKTEAQKQADALAQAQRDAEQARAEAARYKVAASHGVSADYFDLLGSGDEATLNARAERLSGLLSSKSEIEQMRAELDALKQGKPAPISSRPVADLKPGASPEYVQTEDDAAYTALFGQG